MTEQEQPEVSEAPDTVAAAEEVGADQVINDPSEAEEPGAGESGAEAVEADTPVEEQPPPAPARTAADISGAVEALLLLADDPVSETSLAQTLDVPVDVVSECLQDLVTFYDETRRGFELRRVGEGWRYYTRAEHADVITVSVLEGQQSRLSQAALETLAVVAYQQPISRGRISAVRGVNVDGVIRTLLARGLLEEAGADEDSGAAVFRTTSYFLERMGLKSLDELPDLAPHLPEVDELEAELGRLAAVPDEADQSIDQDAVDHEQPAAQPTEEAAPADLTHPDASVDDTPPSGSGDDQ